MGRNWEIKYQSFLFVFSNPRIPMLCYIEVATMILLFLRD